MEQLTHTTTTEELAVGPRQKGGRSESSSGARRGWPLLVGTAVLAAAVGAGLGIWAVDDSTSADKPVSAASLRQLELRRLQAQVAADVNTTDELLAPDFTSVTPDGSVLTKDDALDLLRTGNVDFTAIDVLGDIAVRDYGDAAVLTYRSRMSLNLQGAGPLTHDAWDTVVYEEHGGHWLVSSSQTTGVGFSPPGSAVTG
jgi:hypothetical protein